MIRTIEERFKKLTEGLTRKVDFDRWPDDIFFFRGKKCLFEYDFISGHLWCDREKVWKVLECEGCYSYEDIQAFIKKQVETHFKLMEVTPISIYHYLNHLAEQHFKNK